MNADATDVDPEGGVNAAGAKVKDALGMTGCSGAFGGVATTTGFVGTVGPAPSPVVAAGSTVVAGWAGAVVVVVVAVVVGADGDVPTEGDRSRISAKNPSVESVERPRSFASGFSTTAWYALSSWCLYFTASFE